MRTEIRQEGPVTIACVAGEIDMANALQFADEALGKMADDSTALVIDMTELQYIDSAGVRSIFEIAAALKMRDQFFGIALLGGSPLRSVLKVMQVEDVASICGTLEEALDLALAPRS